MTQPARPPTQTHWLSDLLNRRYGTKNEGRKSYKPVGFEFERDPFDPSSYYRALGTFKDVSRAATGVVKQKVANQAILDREREMQELRAALGRINYQPGGPGGGGGTYKGPGPKGKRPGSLGAPLRGYSISSGYGPRGVPTPGANAWHTGLDMAAAMGSPIYATHDGIVGFSGWGGGYGNNITINGPGGLQTFYGHNSKNIVRAGQRVQQGQLIGYVGSTGISTGPHLHYEVRINGQHVNPRSYLP